MALGSRLSDKSREKAKDIVDHEIEEKEEHENEERGGTRGLGDEVQAGTGMGMVLGQPHFRVGFAGRGGVGLGRGGMGLRGLRWNRRGGGDGAGPSDDRGEGLNEK